MTLRADLERHRGAPARPLANARGSWKAREGLVLRLTDGAGRVGVGEASPLPGYSRETLSDCADGLSRVTWRGFQPDSLEEVLHFVAALALPPAARFAAETALLDLLAQTRGQPLHVLLGAPRRPPPVPLAALVEDSPDEALARGVRTLKLKLGGPATWTADLARARGLRARVGAAVALRFDANQGFPSSAAPEVLRALAALGAEWVEEPVRPGQLAALGAFGVPVAADESLQDLDEWPVGNCRVMVLKPMALGGFGRCLEWARRAAATGATAVVSHLWDGPVALGAAAALALALPGRAAAGLDRHAGLTAWPERPLPFLTPTEVVAP